MDGGSALIITECGECCTNVHLRLLCPGLVLSHLEDMLQPDEVEPAPSGADTPGQMPGLQRQEVDVLREVVAKPGVQHLHSVHQPCHDQQTSH